MYLPTHFGTGFCDLESLKMFVNPVSLQIVLRILLKDVLHDVLPTAVLYLSIVKKYLCAPRSWANEFILLSRDSFSCV